MRFSLWIAAATLSACVGGCGASNPVAPVDAGAINESSVIDEDTPDDSTAPGDSTATDDSGVDSAVPEAGPLGDAGDAASQNDTGAPDAVAPDACGPYAGGVGGVIAITPGDAADAGGDFYPAIQNAVNSACATTSGIGHPPVFLSQGTYPTSQPILVNCANLEIVGACRSGTVIAPSFNGPAVLIDPPGDVVNLTLGPALVGNGNAMTTEGENVYVNLRDVPTVELDGLSAFTVEAFFEMSDASGGGIVSSYGCIENGAAFGSCTQAFGLDLNGQYTGVAITIGGKQIGLGGQLVSLNVVHHYALSYDGSMVRLFLDGALVDSAPATGTVTQAANEDVTIGPVMMGLENQPIGQPIHGAIDSVRISNTARYTVAFTPPTAKLTSDASTLALENFDVQRPGLTRVIAGSDDYWLPVRRTADDSGVGLNFVGGISLHDFSVHGGMGIFGWLVVQSELYQLDCIGCDYGFTFSGNSYEDRFDDLRATAGSGRGRFGLLTRTANGDDYNNVTLSGQVLPFVVSVGAQEVVTNLTIAAGPSTVDAMTLVFADDVIEGATITAPASTTHWHAAVRAVAPWAKLQIQGGQIGSAAGGVPVYVDQGAGALVEGTSFVGTSTSPEVIQVNGTTTFPNVVVAATKDSTVPWSNDPGIVSVSGPDPGSPPIPSVVPVSYPGPGVVLGVVAPASVFDVTAYGAVGDGNTDSAPGIQSAIDAACSAGGGTVFLPAGSYVVAQPPRVHCDHLEIDGTSARGTSIATRWTGPTFVLNPSAMTGVDLVPALVGTGNAMKMDGAGYWLELRDSPTLELDGMAAFTAEAFIAPSAASSAYGGIVQSFGCLGSGGSLPGCTSAFALAMDGTNLVGTLSVGGTVHTLAGPPVALASTHHVALSYDGSNIRLFLDGAVVASQAASGTVTQRQQEDVTLGPATVGFDAAVHDPAMNGVVDSVRLSSSARYTAAFSPPSTKLAGDASALLLLNFDVNPAGLSQAMDSAGHPVWLAVRRLAEPNGSAETTITGTTIRSLSVSGEGIIGMNAVSGLYTDLYAQYSEYGLALFGTSAGSVFDAITILATNQRGRYGLVAINGDNNVYHWILSNYPELPLVIEGGTNERFDDIFITPQPTTSLYGAYFIQSDDDVEGMYFDNEAASSVWQGNLAIVQPTAPFQLFKGEIDSMTNRGTPITIDGGKGLLIEGTSFGNSSVAPELIHLNSPTTETNVVIGITLDSTTKISDDPALESIGN